MVEETSGETTAAMEQQSPTAEFEDTTAESVFGGEVDAPFTPDGGSVFRPDASHSTDALAKKEAIAISTGTLEADAKKQEHGRHQKFRDHINKATLIVFWTVVACLVVSIIVFTFHMISPEGWHFLSDEQIGTLKTLLGGAILSSAMSGYVTNRMKE